MAKRRAPPSQPPLASARAPDAADVALGRHPEGPGDRQDEVLVEPGDADAAHPLLALPVPGERPGHVGLEEPRLPERLERQGRRRRRRSRLCPREDGSEPAGPPARRRGRTPWSVADPRMLLASLLPVSGRRFRRQLPVPPHERHREDEPHGDEAEVDDREAARVERHPGGAREDHEGGGEVAEAHEEAVHGLLGLVLLLAGRGQPQQLLGGVHHRVVGRVLGRLGRAHDGHGGPDRHEAVGPERDQGEGVEDAGQAEALDEAGRHEGLQQHGDDVHPEEVAAVVRADVGVLVEGGVRGGEGRGVLHHEVAQDVLADGVDDVQDDEQDRDEQDVAVAEHERERVALLEGRLGRGGPGRGGDRARAAPVHRHVEDEGEEQQPRRQVQHQVRAHVGVEETPGGPGPDRAARGRADPDDGEEPVARVLRVDVVRVRPELGDDRQAEEAHPHVERHADERHPGVHRDREGEDVRREEERHPDDQLHPVDARREPAVGGHEGHEDEGLAGGGEGLHLGRALDPERLEELRHLGAQDERLADGLDHVVRDEDQEHVHEHEEGASPLPGVDLGEEPEKAVEGAAAARRGRVGVRVHVTCADAVEVSGTTNEEHTGLGSPAPNHAVAGNG